MPSSSTCGSHLCFAAYHRSACRPHSSCVRITLYLRIRVFYDLRLLILVIASLRVVLSTTFYAGSRRRAARTPSSFSRYCIIASGLQTRRSKTGRVGGDLDTTGCKITCMSCSKKPHEIGDRPIVRAFTRDRHLFQPLPPIAGGPANFCIMSAPP